MFVQRVVYCLLGTGRIRELLFDRYELHHGQVDTVVAEVLETDLHTELGIENIPPIFILFL